ncbi:MAG: GerMN domain-containing protein [Treponema sp.]|nr:GerMN domain-containing protein [Treponema sp.]
MKISIKKLIPYFAFTAVAAVLLIIAASFYAAKGYGKRFVFIFPSVDEGKYVLETRYLKNNPNKDYINFFLDELVLGSGLERTKYLFTPGTKIISCFERNQMLYLNLSADIINMGHNVIQIKDGMELLKENVYKNFPDIKEVQIFVDGNYAYEIEKYAF